MTPAKVRAPAGRGKAGKALWARLPAVYEIAGHAQVILERAGRRVDQEAARGELLRTGGLVVTGSTGQSRLSGAVAELRQTQVAVTRVLGSLSMPDEQNRPLSAAGLRARKAGNSRWDRQRQLQARREGA